MKELLAIIRRFCGERRKNFWYINDMVKIEIDLDLYFLKNELLPKYEQDLINVNVYCDNRPKKVKTLYHKINFARNFDFDNNRYGLFLNYDLNCFRLFRFWKPKEYDEWIIKEDDDENIIIPRWYDLYFTYKDLFWKRDNFEISDKLKKCILLSLLQDNYQCYDYFGINI